MIFTEKTHERSDGTSVSIFVEIHGGGVESQYEIREDGVAFGQDYDHLTKEQGDLYDLADDEAHQIISAAMRYSVLKHLKSLSLMEAIEFMAYRRGHVTSEFQQGRVKAMYWVLRLTERTITFREMKWVQEDEADFWVRQYPTFAIASHVEEEKYETQYAVPKAFTISEGEKVAWKRWWKKNPPVLEQFEGYLNHWYVETAAMVARLEKATGLNAEIKYGIPWKIKQHEGTLHYRSDLRSETPGGTGIMWVCRLGDTLLYSGGQRKEVKFEIDESDFLEGTLPFIPIEKAIRNPAFFRIAVQ